MIKNLNNDNNITIVLELIRYPVTYESLILIHKRLQHMKLTRREGVFILHLSVQQDIWIGMGTINKV